MSGVAILGSTGSVGTQALDVVRASGGRLRVAALAANRSVELLAAQAREFRPAAVALADPAEAARLRRDLPAGVRFDVGTEAVAALATVDEVDVVLNALTGAVGLLPTLAALDGGRRLALANKESLIIGGDLVVGRAKPGQIVPVDSEHSGLAQCLRAGDMGEVDRLVLTASGGPFRGWSAEQLAAVTPDQALAHPTWAMGPVITINSATLMNKGQEVIEAHLLFGIPYDRIDVVVHPQSVVHAMVTFRDGSTVAQLSMPDMRLPIGLALGWPTRLERPYGQVDWSTARSLTFEPVDRGTFPLLDVAIEAGRRGGVAPAVCNAANEEAVAAFLAGRLSFPGIAAVVAAALAAATAGTDVGAAETAHDAGTGRAREVHATPRAGRPDPLPPAAEAAAAAHTTWRARRADQADEAPDGASDEALNEAPDEVPGKVPAEALDELLAKAPDEAPDEARGEARGEARRRAPTRPGRTEPVDLDTLLDADRSSRALARTLVAEARLA